MKIGNVALLLSVGIGLVSCGGKSGKSSAPPAAQSEVGVSDKKLLASNIIFDSLLGETAFALDGDDGIDRNTKVLASNVQFSLNKRSAIGSVNVQAALEEIAPSLKDVLVGTWKIVSYGNQCHGLESEVVFREDGSYELVSGGFLLGNVGSCPDWENNAPIKNVGNFEVAGNGLIIFKSKSTSSVPAVMVSALTTNSFSMFSYNNGAVATRK
jgi:hypothetical protein